MPKVGAPERKDMEERKLPRMTGAPGRTSWVSATPTMASAIAWATAPPRMKGTTTAHWLAAA